MKYINEIMYYAPAISNTSKYTVPETGIVEHFMSFSLFGNHSNTSKQIGYIDTFKSNVESSVS